MKKIAMVMGSDSDWPIVEKAALALKELRVPYDVRVISAHRTPEAAAGFAKSARENGYGALIAAAGMAAHLAGALAANTALPVIGIPVVSGAMGGLDALLSTVQMPPGIPVAAVAVNGAKNAAILAAQMLAITDDALALRLTSAREAMAKAAITKDEHYSMAHSYAGEEE